MKDAIQYETGKIEDGVTLGTNLKIKTKRILIKKNCVIGDNVEIRADNLLLEEEARIGSQASIFSQSVHIGEKTRIDDNVTITAYEKFRIGKNSIVAKNARFKARSIEIGDFLYTDENPIPLRIGGGGANRPTARIKIGSRCVIHDSFINVFMPVEIGDDVGFSPESKIITHGFWNSVIEGYSGEFAPVKVGNHVIVGYRAIILPGVTIGDYCTIGAGAVVTKSFGSHCLIGGVPAKLIKTRPDYPKELTLEDKLKIMEDLMGKYAELLQDKVDNVTLVREGDASIVSGQYISQEFRIVFSPSIEEKSRENLRSIFLAFENVPISENDFMINLSDYSWGGTEDEISDDLRDFLRHYGIRIFSRHFRSIPPKLKRELESV